MSLLIPKFSLVTWTAIVAFFVLSLVCGGDPNPDLARAELVTALVIGGALLAGAIKEGIKNRRMKKDAEALAAAEKERAETFGKDVDPLLKPALEGIKDPTKYTKSEAKLREEVEDLKEVLDTQYEQEAANIGRGALLGTQYGSGKKFQMMDSLAKRRADAMAGAKLGLRRDSDALAESKLQADKMLVERLAAQKAGMTPMPQPSTPGLGETLLGVGQQGLAALGTSGLIGGGGGAGAGAGTGSGIAAPSSQAVDATNMTGDGSWSNPYQSTA